MMKKLQILGIALLASQTMFSQINSQHNQRINNERYRAAVSNQHGVDTLNSMKKSADESDANYSDRKFLSDHLDLLFLKKEKLQKSQSKNTATLEKLRKMLRKEEGTQDAQITFTKIKRLEAEQAKIPEEMKMIDEEIQLYQKKYRDATAKQ